MALKLGLKPSTYQAKPKPYLSVTIKSRYYTLQEILTVENNSSDMTFVFQCNKGTVRLGPHQSWEHGYLNGGTAIETMQTIEIVEVTRAGKRLFDGECDLEFVKFKVGWTARADAMVTANPVTYVRLVLGDPTAVVETVLGF